MQAVCDVRSFQESLVWWQSDRPIGGSSRQTCAQSRQQQQQTLHSGHSLTGSEAPPTGSRSGSEGPRDTGHNRCNGAAASGVAVPLSPLPGACGQAGCAVCRGDVVLSEQRRCVVHGLRGRRACLDPVLAAMEGREHLLSDLEVTVLVLLAHGAPVSIRLDDHTVAAPRPSCSSSASEALYSGSSPGAAAAVYRSGTSASAGKWWLPVDVPDEMHGDGRALVDACSCNSWPLVAALLACIPPEATLHKVRSSAAA